MARKKTISSGLGLFTANKVQGLTENRASIVNVTAASVTGSISTNVTSSFRYDDPGNPLKSTQQLNIDWSKFENHTFFNSAEAKVNMAFEQIINNYPFDGTVDEIFNFEDKLTGFEKYVLGAIPQYTGFLNFNKSQFITVTDRAGNLYPALSRTTDARAILDPGVGPFAFEMHLHIPVDRDGNEAAKKQVIAQKIKNNNGITLYTEPTATANSTHSDVVLLATSGSTSATGRVTVKRGKWHHISACLDRRPGKNRIEIFVDGRNKFNSSPFEIFDFGFTDSDLTIGIGTNLVAPHALTFTDNIGLLSASIDDFRVLHSGRSESALDHEKTRKIEPRKSLKLYLTFNEPTGSYNNQTVVLDHSGNSLHSRISRQGGLDYDENCRKDQANLSTKYGNPMKQEDPARYPVLFPSQPDLVDFNTKLMVSASIYDTNNPNMITKLVPDHYLREAHFNEGFDESKELGNTEDPYGTNTDFPGGGKMGSPQIIAALLFTWAKQFDEMKLYLDQFGQLLTADYKEEDTVADTFLPFMAQYFGFDLPDMFPNVSMNQFAGKEGQGTDIVLAKHSLQKIQNTLWRRVLADVREIIRSKGTIHGIKTFMRNLGIDPDRSFRFREYGGSRTGRIGGSRQEIKEIARVLSFADALSATSALTGSLPKLVKNRDQGDEVVYTRPVGVYSDSPLIVSPFLSGTRVESGSPLPQVKSSEFLLANSSSYAIPTTATATLTVADGNAIHGMTAGQKITLESFDGKKVDYFISDTSNGAAGVGHVAHLGIVEAGDTLDDGVTASLTAGATGIAIGFNLGQALPGGTDQGEFLLKLRTAIAHANGHGGRIRVLNNKDASAASIDGNQTITLSQNKATHRGNTVITTNISNLSKTNFTGGTVGPKILRSGKHAKFGVSPEPSDGLFTSGSWTCEAMYIYGGTHTIGTIQPVTQSLMRMYVTGTAMNAALNDPPDDSHTKEQAKAAIKFQSQPADGSTIVLTDNDLVGDPADLTTKTFEFDDTAKITVTTDGTTSRVNGASFSITSPAPDSVTKTYIFTDSATEGHETATVDGSGRIRINVGDQPNGIASFVSIAVEITKAINSSNGHSSVMTAHRNDRVVSLESIRMGHISKTDPTGGSNPSDIVISVGSLSDAANIRVPISPRGVEYTAKNFVTQVRSQAALKITPTLLGDAKTARLVMDTPGITDSSKYKPKIVTSGVTNTSIKHFLGGFNDEFLGFAGSSARGTFTPETGHHGRTMLTNLVALSGSDDLQTTGSLVLFARPVPGRDPLVMALTGTDVFDGDRWNICYGRVRNDLTGTNVSSSYFLQASKAIGNRLIISNRVEKIFDDHETSLNANNTVFRIEQIPNAGDTVTLIDDDATSKTYQVINAPTSETGGTVGGNVKVAVGPVESPLASTSAVANEFVKAIMSANGHGVDARANGSIVIPARASESNVSTLKNQLNTDTFLLIDTLGNEQLFRFRSDTDDSVNGIVGLKSDISIEGIAESIQESINNVDKIRITALKPTTSGNTNAAHTVVLEQDFAGAAGDTSITYANAGDEVEGDALAFNSFTGGTDAQFKVVRVDSTLTVSQETEVPPRITISESAGNKIKASRKRTATNLSAFSNISNINRSGSFLMVGDIKDSIEGSSDKTYGLDGKNLAANTSLDNQQALMAQTTKFGGNISQIRFWSKALTEKEHQEHALNFKSVGVEKPATNFGFSENVPGSFEKLRLDVSVDQEVTGSDSNNAIILKDFSQNGFDMEGYAFGTSKQTVFPKTFKFSILNPNFDQSSNTNKVRVRSYLDPAVARRELVDVAPVYHIPKSEKQHDDLRFGIEISVTQALNEDIVNIFATMEEIENALGAPESQFDVGYAGLENIRDVYFNRLTDKINITNFFQFFRWFDNTIGGTIESLVPRKTKFTGVNYIIEPHLLERPKFVYNTSDMYLGENNRHGLKGEILLRQFVVMIRRF